MENKIKLGVEVKDKITGYKGIATAKTVYLYGCTSYGVTPKIGKDGKREAPEWFDEGRLEVIGKGISPEDVQAEKPGGDSASDKM